MVGLKSVECERSYLRQGRVRMYNCGMDSVVLSNDCRAQDRKGMCAIIIRYPNVESNSTNE